MSEQTKSMRIRVNTSRTQKGFSTDGTCEVTWDKPEALSWREMGEVLEEVVLERHESVMAKLNAQYPRESS